MDLVGSSVDNATLIYPDNLHGSVNRLGKTPLWEPCELTSVVEFTFVFLLGKLVCVSRLETLEFDEILLDKLVCVSLLDKLAVELLLDKLVVVSLLGKDKLFSVGPKRKTIKRRMIHKDTRNTFEHFFSFHKTIQL